MRFFAFEGIRYAGSDAEAGRRAAPPFDQIDEAARERLQALDPRHFAHLSRPVGGEGRSPAEHAAALHRAWLEDRHVGRDGRPALYPYEIRLAGGGARLGICGLVGLEEREAGVIRPHEQTITKTVEERLELVRAMGVDLEPILLLSEDSGELDALVRRDLRGPLLAAHRDPAGHQHLLYRIDDPDRIARYRKVLEGVAGLIADGHHRYRVAQLYASVTGHAGAVAAKLAVVTSIASSGLAIDPIHRALPASSGAPDLDGLAGAVRSRRKFDGDSGSALATAVAAAGQPALGVRAAGGDAEIWSLDPARGPESLPAAASELAVVLLHHTLLPRLGLRAEAATDGTVRYRSDPETLWREVDSGAAGVGFWLPPMTPAGFAAAIADGDLLPPKSTRFLPKLVSGLVWAPHDSRLG